jgi:acyl-[acyl-carrier-protein] desaturase
MLFTDGVSAATSSFSGGPKSQTRRAWELVLLHSGVRTQEQLNEYRDRVADHRWTMGENHPGFDTPLGLAAYAMVQERATYFNYDELRKRIRADYGLPEQVTPEERQRGHQLGAAAAFKIVSTDEIAHHGMFSADHRYPQEIFPLRTLDMVFQVLSGFNMPALYILPDAQEMKEALERTKLYTPLKHGRSVANPVLDALGFDNKRALERAVQQSKTAAGRPRPRRRVDLPLGRVRDRDAAGLAGRGGELIGGQ